MDYFKKNNFSSNQILISIFVIWLFGLTIFSQLFFCLSSLNVCLNFSLLANWDGQHFLQIAKNGYLYPYQFAFFPLYPSIISFIRSIIPLPLWIIGVGINIWCAVGSFLFLAKIIQRQKFVNLIEIALLILAFPVSFFFITVYSEALFLFLSIAAIYYYQRNKTGMAILFLTALTLTRMAGVALVMAIIIDRYFDKKRWQLFLIPFLGVGGFALFGYLKTGILFSIVFAETHWERMITFPGFAIYNSVSILIREGISYQGYSLAIDLLLVIGVLILLFKSFHLLPRIYFYYAFFSLLIPLSTSTFLSLPRFLLVVFPLFMAFYIWSNKITRLVYYVIGFIFSIIFLIYFLQGGWVA
jgi:Gpi18-like mannosyltransferase